MNRYHVLTSDVWGGGCSYGVVQTRIAVRDAATGNQPSLTSGVVAAQKEPDEPILATISTTHRPDSSTPMLTEVVQVHTLISFSFSFAESLKRLACVNGNMLL